MLGGFRFGLGREGREVVVGTPPEPAEAGGEQLGIVGNAWLALFSHPWDLQNNVCGK